MTDEPIGERIKALEMRLCEALRLLEASTKDRQELRAMLEEIKRGQRMQTGFIGGMIFVLSAIWAFVTFIANWFKPHA